MTVEIRILPDAKQAIVWTVDRSDPTRPIASVLLNNGEWRQVAEGERAPDDALLEVYM